MDSEPCFSQRENEVVALLLTGKSNKQIAHALGISTRTVEFHLGNIYTKLQVSTRSEAILQLSRRQLGESTGDVKGQHLREAPVEIAAQPVHNRVKSFFAKWRPSMKTQLYLGTGLFAALLLITLYTFSRNNPTPLAGQPSATVSPASLVNDSAEASTPQSPLPSPTLTARQQIVAEVVSLAAVYDQAVNAEIKSGEVTVSTDPKTGQQVIRFAGKSMETISKLHEGFVHQLRDLNNEYMLLYIADVQPTPFPTQPSQGENDAYYQQLLGGYPAYIDQVLKDGPTVRVYDPAEGIYFNMVIGDAFAASEVMAGAMEALRLAPTILEVNQEADVNQIRLVTGDPGLQLTFAGVQELANAPWIKAALYSDGSGSQYWVAIQGGRLAQIEPSFAPEVPAMQVKTIDEVRPMAERFAQDNSPRYTQLKSELIYEEGNKGDIYFFTWSYRNKDWTGTNWQVMAPFLQIGLSADGKLITYINTLDLFY